MSPVKLIKESQEAYIYHSELECLNVKEGVFTSGARRMHHFMISENIVNTPFNPKLNFEMYGWGKYLLALAGALTIFSLIEVVSFWSLVLTIFAFYLIEVHGLFLFPLLISEDKFPLGNSISMTYSCGLLLTSIKVMLIGAYMLIGLLNFKNPLKNWNIGCYSIVLWFKHEITVKVK